MLRNRIAVALLTLAPLAASAGAQITLVDMVPQARSGETNQDAEPTIAVNPANPQQLAGSAFTWDNLNAGPMTGNLAPIYVSTDGGTTWTTVLNVPSTTGASFPTGDINPRFTAAPSGTTSMLYTGILHSNDFNMRIYRANDYRTPVAMTQIDTRSNNVDQPHLGGLMSLHGDAGADHVYVGFNNGYGGVSPTGRTAAVDWTLAGAAAVPAFNLSTVETRSTGTIHQDGYSTVPSVHPDGTVYVAFYGIRGGSFSLYNTDVVVVRDDHFGADGFGSLTGAGGLAGVQVVTGRNLANTGFLGQNRLGASNIALCVDPNDSDRVYLVWGDQPASTTGETLHVRVSTDRGAHWGNDLLTVANAMNPAIAVNSHGRVGLLYQAWGSNRWQTVFRRTTNAAGTTFDAGVVLADTDSTTPTRVYSPYIGDYTGLVARGQDFYGVFSASNFPDAANFPTVAPTYQRYVNWGTHTLFSNAAMTVTVAPSIDPFFFHSAEVAAEDDFYVRDWTDSPTSGDDGAEPSTHADFYARPDVWNRRGPTDGSPFPSDRPANEPAGNGAGNLGDNWAFSRIRRNGTGTADTVAVHYAVSPFGTGSNYADGVTVTSPGLTFIGPDPSVSFLAGEAGPKTAAAREWHLDAIASTHLCLAVEISTASDPYLAPGIVGHTPGWGTGTDLEILNDNNKAQRNMGLTSTPSHGGPASGSITNIALIHNAATWTRDLQIRYDVPREVLERFGGAVTISEIGGERTHFKPGAILTLKHMRPGENRWIAVTLPAAAIREGEVLPVYFSELKEGRVVNGFGIGLVGTSPDVAIQDALRNFLSTFQRAAVLYRSRAAGEVAERATKWLREPLPERFLVQELRGEVELIDRALEELDEVSGGVGRFGSREQLDRLRKAVSAQDATAAAFALTSLANLVDARITSIELGKGNVSDVLQTLRWGRDLFSRAPLDALECAAGLVRQSDKFERTVDARKATLADYPELVAEQRSCLARGAETLHLDLGRELDALGQDRTDLRALQKAHYDVLLRLSEARSR